MMLPVHLYVRCQPKLEKIVRTNMFKSKNIAMAVAAAMGGLAMTTTAHAVNLAVDGQGQMLNTSYYGVRDGWNTVISITNTSDTETVAAKIRFHEGYNSRDVLDFVVVLSPSDIFNGYLMAGADGVPVFHTQDKSCTVPAIPAAGVPLSTLSITGDNADGYTTVSPAERIKEGYVDIQMMGSVGENGTIAVAAKHNDSGVPANCKTIRDLFVPVTYPNDFPTPVDLATLRAALPNYSINPLMGQWNLTNGVKGIMTAGQQMIALADMVDLALPPFVRGVNTLVTFQLPPSALTKAFNSAGAFAASYILPTLGMTNTPAQLILADGTSYVFSNTGGTAGVQAVSTLLQRSDVNNEWTRRNPAGIAGNDWTTATNWILNFPTKRFYVDNGTSPYAGRAKGMPGLPTEKSLFGELWGAGGSCHEVARSIYDREEYSLPPVASDPPFSPSPFEREDPVLCSELAIIQFGDKTILNSGLTYGIPQSELPGSFGWMNLDLAVNWPNNRINQYGLPVFGFALYQRVVESDADNKNDVFAVQHAFERNMPPLAM